VVGLGSSNGVGAAGAEVVDLPGLDLDSMWEEVEDLPILDLVSMWEEVSSVMFPNCWSTSDKELTRLLKKEI